jgi:hypothetical protein
VDAAALARYIVAIVEGSIMLMCTQQDPQMIARHFDCLKDRLKQSLGVAGSSARDENKPPTRFTARNERKNQCKVAPACFSK